MCKIENRLLFLLLIPLFLLAEGDDFQHSKIIYYYPSEKDSVNLYPALDLLLANDCKIIKNKRVAVVCNSGSLDRKGVHMLDRFSDREDFQLVAIIQTSQKEFNTESSGLAYSQFDSANITKNILITPNHPVVKQADLNGANLILVDLQYLGIRYDVNYDVVNSLLKLSAERRIPLVLLDRPNPLTAAIMEGPLTTSPGLAAAAQIPWRYGMTIGELALLINEEGLADSGNAARLYLIPMVNYNRRDWYDRLGLPWGIPLENIYTIEKLLKYCSTCFYYYSNISNGPGSLFQYEVGGAPWISGSVLIDRLNDMLGDYAEFSWVTFIPGSRSHITTSGVYIGEECSGIKINIPDRKKYHTSTVGTCLLGLIAQLYPGHFRWREPDRIDQLFGAEYYRALVDAKADLRQLHPVWLSELTSFQKLHTRYLLYSDL